MKCSTTAEIAPAKIKTSAQVSPAQARIKKIMGEKIKKQSVKTKSPFIP